MPTIHEVATITAKGQITLPKPIRQALGVDYGGKVAFDLRGSQVIVTRAEDPSHEDPAIVRRHCSPTFGHLADDRSRPLG
jgi:antitoxin PrlF